MSFLTVPFSRLKNTSDDNYETTEMTQIVDINSFMSLMDGRTILDNHLEDDNSSLSSDNTESMNPNSRHAPTNNGVKYSYIEDEDEDEFNTHTGDEAEQSLVGNRSNDLENGNSNSIKKVE